VLTDAKGTTLTSGTQTGLSSYNVAASPYSTLSAQQDADKRAAQDMAERIRIDLAAYFRRGKK
jgi:LPS-assembly lipoprotein